MWVFRTKHTRPVALLATAPIAVALWAASCGGDDNATGCTSDVDCRGDRVCQEGSCVEPSGGTSNTTSTSSNATSNDTSVGTSNTTSSNTTNCTGDSDCPTGEVCDGNMCGTLMCMGDDDCGNDTRFCFGGICQPVLSCTDDGDCTAIGGTCQDGICEPSCIVDGDCSNPTLEACVDGVCVSRCLNDNQCDGGDVCQDNLCVTPECMGDGTEDCPDGERCRQGQCEPFTACDTDAACLPEEVCRDGICDPRTPCIGDGQCAEIEQCIDNLCFAAELCEARDDCPGGLDCVSGRCVPFVCRGPADCADDELCEGGTCTMPDADPAITDVIILTEPQLIVEGQIIDFVAVTLDATGAIIPGQPVTWASDNVDVAEIDGDTGRATGGTDAGEAAITASFGDVTSTPVKLTHPGAAVEGQPRVTVIDAQTGDPIEGAEVTRGEGQAATDANGQVTFAPTDGATMVSVYAEGYNYTTLMGLISADVVVPLRPASGNAAIGGFTGEQDISEFNTAGDVTLGLTGASLDRELSGIDLEAILGDPFQTQIAIPGLFEADLPLPGGLTLFGSVFGFPLTIKETYYAQ
ncbi:MAG: hypothetical protein AAFS10_11610, partial [Myxococcota bacterium]